MDGHPKPKPKQEIHMATQTPTATTISGYKSRIYSLTRLGAKKSVARVKVEALVALQNVPEVDRQWVADQWYGRCSKTTFETLVLELSRSQ